MFAGSVDLSKQSFKNRSGYLRGRAYKRIQSSIIAICSGESCEIPRPASLLSISEGNVASTMH